MKNNETKLLICDCCACELNELDAVRTHGGIYCEDCAAAEFLTCEHCGELCREDDGVFVKNSTEFYCKHCAEKCLYICADCGAAYRNAWWGEYIGNDWYCDDCKDNHKKIKSYHNKKKSGAPLFFHYNGIIEDEKPEVLTLGIELEIDNEVGDYNNNDTAAFIEKKIGSDGVYFEDDCSTNDGFEIITQPHDINSFLLYDWGAIFDELKRRGYSSFNSGDCGLHIHFNRSFLGNNDEEIRKHIAKLKYLYFKYYEIFLTLSRRFDTDTYYFRNYRGFVFDDGDVKGDLKALEEHNCNRYYCVNTATHRDGVNEGATFEIRMGRGTLNEHNFINWVLLNYLFVKNLKNIDADNINNPSAWVQFDENERGRFENAAGWFLKIAADFGRDVVED